MIAFISSRDIMFTKPQNMTHKLQFQWHNHNVIFYGARLLHDLKTKIKRCFQNQKCSNSLFHCYLCFDCGKVTFQINFVFNAHSVWMVVWMTSKFVLESFYFAQVGFCVFHCDENHIPFFFKINGQGSLLKTATFQRTTLFLYSGIMHNVPGVW